jgi:hypothetical protein
MAKKFFRIKKKEFFNRLDLLQEREAALKGTINTNLCIYYRDENDNLMRNIVMGDVSWGKISKSIAKALRLQELQKVTVGNEYFDWEITVFSRL